MPFSDCFEPRAIKDRKRADKKMWWKREMAVQHSIFCQFTFFHRLIRESYCYRDFSMNDVISYCEHLVFAGFSELRAMALRFFSANNNFVYN